MKNRFIISNPEDCTGCRICQIVCSSSNERGFNTSLSRIKVVHEKPFNIIAFTCRLCEKPKCVQSCPNKALKIDESMEILIIDKEKCTGCRLCIKACPFGVISINKKEKKAIACNLCQLQPKCIEACPRGALKIKNSEELTQKEREILNKLFPVNV